MQENLQKYISLQDQFIGRMQFKTNILMQLIAQDVVSETQYLKFQKRVSIPLSQPLDDISKYVIERESKRIISQFIQNTIGIKEYVIQTDVIPVGLNNLYAQLRTMIVFNPSKKSQ